MDRQKIRQYEIRKEREARQQAEADEMAGRAVNLAAEGNDTDTICRILDEDKIPYSREYIEKLVADATARAEAGVDEDEETEELIEMSKVRFLSEVADVLAPPPGLTSFFVNFHNVVLQCSKCS